MPRFYLEMNTASGRSYDAVGECFADLDAARAEAVVCAREIVAEQIRKGEGLHAIDVEVSDHNRRPLVMVPFDEILKPDVEPADAQPALSVCRSGV